MSAAGDRKRATPDLYGVDVHCLDGFDPAGIPVVERPAPRCDEASDAATALRVEATLRPRRTSDPGMPHAIRPAEPQDRPALQQLYSQAVVDAPWLPAEASGWRDLAETSKGEVLFVCCDPDGALLGFVSVHQADSFVHHLYVSPHRQRQGVATALLDSLHSWLPMPWRLKCVTANALAMRFYRTRGWTVESRGTGSDGPYALLRKDKA